MVAGWTRTHSRYKDFEDLPDVALRSEYGVLPEHRWVVLISEHNAFLDLRQFSGLDVVFLEPVD